MIIFSILELKARLNLIYCIEQRVFLKQSEIIDRHTVSLKSLSKGKRLLVKNRKANPVCIVSLLDEVYFF